ncbi:MAG: hypothetical protein DI552_05215 [Brevundimonas sp.]|uniref:Uncharacterized protein n=1 Tax=Brevundimonas albigilva TaxID=1312364 RepID=A0ABY4SMM9_9CAUL|nr:MULTISPECIES: hypothetical protein [Brevundimonas]PZU60036.1 MAG: hypothetical protein DI552_05215 [Brevundimonas sp.]UQV17226.1 hypothetical protein MU852_09655 [Brevundimonas albigilva]URI14956.1 hypothetical protein M8231_14290 [Brevundimonas albigilva]
MTVHATIALDEAVKAKLDALANARQAPIGDIVAMAVWDMAVEEEATPFASTDEETAFEAAVDKGLKSLEEGRLHPQEDVVAALAAQRAARRG